MSLHISAKPGEIAKIVLMPGDPLRAKHIAENFLSDIRLISSTRNAFYFTGTFKGTPVTIGASGMGCPSIGIYSYELFNEYEVECIIRIGTAGGYSKDLKVYDIINVETAYSESTYAQSAFGFTEDNISHQGKAYEVINAKAEALHIPVIKTCIHSSDVFYRKDPSIPKIAVENKCPAVEMEAFSLFANAKYLNKIAATIVTVSDIIPTQEGMSADQRERSLETMYKLALESVIEINKLF